MTQLTLYHAPQSRSAAVRALLIELGADYELHVLNLRKGEQRQPPYLAINPMGKVPAIKHGDAVVTEQAAVYMYLADLFPQAGLAPAIGDPLRGPYLRWMVYYGSCFEPAVTDRSLNQKGAPASSSPYGDFDTMFKTLNDQLAKGPYILGEKFSAADMLWGAALRWITMFKLVPETPEIKAYVERITSRPSFAKAAELDAPIIAAQA